MSATTNNTINPTGMTLTLQTTNERLNGLDPSVTGVVQGFGVLQGNMEKNGRNTVTILEVTTLDHIIIPNKVDINQLSKGMNGISNSIQNLSNSIDGLSNSVDGFSNSMDRLSNSMDKLSNSIDQLSNSMDRLSNSVDRLSNSMDRVSDGLQNLLKKVEEKSDMILEILSAQPTK
ncbi:hypothetical protein RSOLAG22IIIB_04252 [Rhizoctonia solani]|uniref:Uncharacterized protein n=1 Tax=Rhizoctonia solani TaxID=456999 RepID=A0A0K6FXE1_9AGAM|nr:hypothetical protein RSOLAG22IIIB_04252 [Rhizoctonia solani]